MVDIDVGREDEDGDVGQLRADRARSLEALGRVRRRHADVDDRKIGLVQAHEGEEVISVTGLTDDIEAVAVKQTRDAFPHQEVVVAMTTRTQPEPSLPTTIAKYPARAPWIEEARSPSLVPVGRMGYVSTEARHRVSL